MALALCDAGHLAERKDSRCVECKRAYDRARYLERQEETRARAKRWRTKNAERYRANNEAWAAANPEKMAGYFRARYERNREAVIADARARDLADPARQCSRVARRRASKANATPAWVDGDAITAIYREAQTATLTTGVTHSVDHELPIRSRRVCGLHVPWNLRVIPALDNARKGATVDFAEAERRQLELARAAHQG